METGAGAGAASWLCTWWRQGARCPWGWRVVAGCWVPGGTNRNQLAARAFERVSVLVLVLWSWALCQLARRTGAGVSCLCAASWLCILVPASRMSTGRGILPSYLGLCWCNFLLSFRTKIKLKINLTRNKDATKGSWPGLTTRNKDAIGFEQIVQAKLTGVGSVRSHALWREESPCQDGRDT